MDEEVKGWLDLFDARITALEEAEAESDADDKHADNMRVSVVIGILCFAELVTAIYAIYATVHHG